MDYIGNFFAVADAYLSCDLQQMVTRTFNGKSYLELLFGFVDECLFDSELDYVEYGYAIGILMIIIHYCYPSMDTVLDPAIKTVQKFMAIMDNKIQTLLTSPEEEESIRDYYLELARNCIVSVVLIVCEGG